MRLGLWAAAADALMMTLLMQMLCSVCAASEAQRLHMTRACSNQHKDSCGNCNYSWRTACEWPMQYSTAYSECTSTTTCRDRSKLL